jgi:hypothetical protein
LGRGTQAVAHCFRSSFRDWAGDETDFPREVIEHALAHKVRGVEGDYWRGTAFKKRRELMELWCEDCGDGAPEGKVIPTAKARARSASPSPPPPIRGFSIICHGQPSAVRIARRQSNAHQVGPEPGAFASRIRLRRLIIAFR